MKRVFPFLLVMLALSTLALGATPRVALLDFQDETGAGPRGVLVGGTSAEGLAAKAAHFLALQLVENDEFIVIDRRDFTSQLDQEFLGLDQALRPRASFIHAAQILRVDAVLAGSILSFSSGTEHVNRDADKVDFTNLSLRVSVRALDVVDGSILAMGEGVGRKQFRQSTTSATTWGEDEILTLLEEAIGEAVGEMEDRLLERIAARGELPRATLTVLATEDPALVELDGMLVGTTPMDGFQVYTGDHILRVSRPGYETITKRFLIENDLKITAPMFRTDLTALERKEMVEKMDMKIFLTNGEPDFWIQDLR
jgi:hypothetical protein